MNGPAVGVVVAGKYAIERPLSRGGMGSVWVARHRDLRTSVAVKFMEPVLIASADARARFEREARAAAHLDSMHVVQVHDYGVDRGIPYIVMELLKGEDLADRLSREDRLSLAVTADIVTQVCRALRKAHELQLVHRDLKPANIFITERDETQIVKVLDFGIAKAGGPSFGGAATQSGALIGTLHYMSPEQARGSKDVDHRSDLWSLGVIVFRALTGQLPFAGDEVGDVIVKICTDPIPVATSVAPDLPPEVDSFMARALARQPDERFQSVGELVEALTALARPRLLARRVAPPPAQPPTPATPAAAQPLTPATPDAAEPASLANSIEPIAAPSEPIPLSSTMHAGDAGGRRSLGPPSSSMPVSLSDDDVSIVEERRKGTAYFRPSLTGASLLIRDDGLVVVEVEPPQADSDAVPEVDVLLSDTLEPPLPKKAAAVPGSSAPNEDSFSPSLQTIHPHERARRIVGIVIVGTVIAAALLMVIGAGWWPPKEPETPSAATAASASSPKSVPEPTKLPTAKPTASSTSGDPVDVNPTALSAKPTAAALATVPPRPTATLSGPLRTAPSPATAHEPAATSSSSTTAPTQPTAGVPNDPEILHY